MSIYTKPCDLSKEDKNDLLNNVFSQWHYRSAWDDRPEYFISLYSKFFDTVCSKISHFQGHQAGSLIFFAEHGSGKTSILSDIRQWLFKQPTKTHLWVFLYLDLRDFSVSWQYWLKLLFDDLLNNRPHPDDAQKNITQLELILSQLAKRKVSFSDKDVIDRLFGKKPDFDDIMQNCINMLGNMGGELRNNKFIISKLFELFIKGSNKRELALAWLGITKDGRFDEGEYTKEKLPLPKTLSNSDYKNIFQGVLQLFAPHIRILIALDQIEAVDKAIEDDGRFNGLLNQLSELANDHRNIYLLMALQESYRQTWIDNIDDAHKARIGNDTDNLERLAKDEVINFVRNLLDFKKSPLLDHPAFQKTALEGLYVLLETEGRKITPRLIILSIRHWLQGKSLFTEEESIEATQTTLQPTLPFEDLLEKIFYSDNDLLENISPSVEKLQNSERSNTFHNHVHKILEYIAGKELIIKEHKQISYSIYNKNITILFLYGYGYYPKFLLEAAIANALPVILISQFGRKKLTKIQQELFGQLHSVKEITLSSEELRILYNFANIMFEHTDLPLKDVVDSLVQSKDILFNFKQKLQKELQLYE